nr:MAG TPA: hypothetical protein [Caudoviricetes sp.]
MSTLRPLGKTLASANFSNPSFTFLHPVPICRLPRLLFIGKRCSAIGNYSMPFEPNSEYKDDQLCRYILTAFPTP